MKAIIPILFIFILSGCWTANKYIQKNPERYQILTDTFIKRGGCKSTLIKTDTIIYDSIVHDTTNKTDSFLIKDCNLDTVVGPIHIRIKGGKLWYHLSVIDTKKVKITTITKTVEDSTRIGLLQKQLSIKSDSIKTILNSEKVLKEKVKTANYRFYILITVLILSTIFYIGVKKNIF